MLDRIALPHPDDMPQETRCSWENHRSKHRRYKKEVIDHRTVRAGVVPERGSNELDICYVGDPQRDCEQSGARGILYPTSDKNTDQRVQGGLQHKARAVLPRFESRRNPVGVKVVMS